MPHHHRICPVWAGYFLLSPLRKLFQNPRKLLAPYVREGMTVMDVGSAMGFFSMPMAQMVGPAGRVYCVDLQEGMLLKLRARAQKTGVENRVIGRKCREDSLEIGDLTGMIDMALASAVVHEVPDAGAFFREVYSVLKTEGVLYLMEPAGHVSISAFEYSLAMARMAGFTVIDRPTVKRSHAALLKKPV